MPKKIRELKAMLTKAGFRSRSGKGSHTFWEYPAHPEISVTVSGKDGKDAMEYQEKQVKDAIKEAEDRS